MLRLQSSESLMVWYGGGELGRTVRGHKLRATALPVGRVAVVAEGL